MAEKHIDEVEGSFSTDDYSNVRDTRTGIWYRLWGAFPAITNIIRMIHTITRAVVGCGGGRIYVDSTDDAIDFSVTELEFIYKGEVKTVNASVGNAMSGGDGVYSVYAVPTSASVQVSAVDAGWPSVPHVRLGQITLASSAWDWSSGFEDFRHQCGLRVVDEPNGGKLTLEDHTAGDTLTASESQSVHTNAGASGSVTLVLPAAAVGLAFEFVVLAVQTLEIEAAAGDTLRVGADVSGAAGTIDANAIGEVVRLVAVSASAWVATSYHGTWTVSAP
jgi:hypothetical protein